MKLIVFLYWQMLQKQRRGAILEEYLWKNRLSTIKTKPMKAELQLESTPVTSKTVVKLFILGSLVLGCVYGILMLFANAVKILE